MIAEPISGLNAKRSQLRNAGANIRVAQFER